MPITLGSSLGFGFLGYKLSLHFFALGEARAYIYFSVMHIFIFPKVGRNQAQPFQNASIWCVFVPLM